MPEQKTVTRPLSPQMLDTARQWAEQGPGRVLLPVASESAIVESLDRWLWSRRIPALKPDVCAALATIQQEGTAHV